MTEDKRIAIEQGILHIIDEQDGHVTQTELSNSLRVSIGLLNAYLKRLVKKGYVKVVNVKASTVRYMLTAEGMAEKYRLTRSYMAHSLSYYKKIKNAVEARILRLQTDGVQTVVFVGSGEIAEIMHLYMGDTNIKLLAVFDDIDNNDASFFGHKIKPISELSGFIKENNVDKILLNYFEDIEAKEVYIKSSNVDEKKIEARW